MRWRSIGVSLVAHPFEWEVWAPSDQLPFQRDWRVRPGRRRLTALIRPVLQLPEGGRR